MAAGGTVDVGNGDWWSANAPPADAGTSSSGVTADQVTQLYQQLLGRAPENQDVINGWINNANTPTLDAIKAAIAASPEAQAYAKTQTAAGGSGGGPPTLNASDPASVAAYVGYYAKQPGANPSLANDPNYWIQKISSGELGTDPNYIVSKFMTPEGAPAGSSGGAAPALPAGSLPGAPANFGATPPTYTAPTWTGGPPPTAPTLATYTAPTQAQLEASPGYQARLDAQDRALNMSAAAKGSVLNGGTQKALARYGQDYASNEYGNLVGQTQSGIALNNNATQTQFGDAFSSYQARYGQFTDAANMGKTAFDTNVANTRNANTDYWTRLNDLYQTGASLANNSYKTA